MVREVNIKDVTSEYLYDYTTREYIETEQVKERWDELKGHLFKKAYKTKYIIDADVAEFMLDEFVRNLQENDYLKDGITFTEEQCIRLAKTVDEIIQEAYGDIEYMYHGVYAYRVKKEEQL